MFSGLNACEPMLNVFILKLELLYAYVVAYILLLLHVTLFTERNNYSSLPRGVSIHVEASVRLCATLPRGERSAQSVVLLGSSNSLSNSGAHMPALFEPRKVAITRRPSTRQSIYAESIYGDIEDAKDVNKEDSNGLLAFLGMGTC